MYHHVMVFIINARRIPRLRNGDSSAGGPGSVKKKDLFTFSGQRRIEVLLPVPPTTLEYKSTENVREGV